MRYGTNANGIGAQTEVNVEALSEVAVHSGAVADHPHQVLHPQGQARQAVVLGDGHVD